MYANQSFLAIIPARGGSKGVPRKNIRPLAGKALIQWTIEAAQNSRYLDRVILSSDDAEIIEVANQAGCEIPFVRPSELAQDDTDGIAPIIHAISALKEKYDYVIVLQPTSPLRTSADIDGAIEYCLKRDSQCCVSVSSVQEHPYWSFKLTETQHLAPLFDNVPKRRQDLPPVVTLNGAIYIAKIDFFLEKKSFLTEDTLAYSMPIERSADIDSVMDFALCEFLLQQQKED